MAIYEAHAIEISTGQRVAYLSDLRDLNFSRRLDGIGTASFRVDGSNEGARQIRGWRHALVIYRLNPWESTKELVWAGMAHRRHTIVSPQGNASIALSFVEPTFLLAGAMADNANGDGRKPKGVQYTTVTPVAHMICDLVQFANLVGNRLIRADHADQGTTAERTIDNWGGGKMISACIEDLSGGATGFEWVCEPTELVDGVGLCLGKWKAGALLGEDRRNARFQFGTGQKNTDSLEHLEDGEYYASAVNHPLPGATSEEDFLLRSPATGSFNPDLPPFEVIENADLFDRGLRQRFVDMHSASRGDGPIETVTFSPGRSDMTGLDDRLAQPTLDLGGEQVFPKLAGAPIPFIDYLPGDRVIVEGAWEGALQVSRIMRVYAIDVSVNDVGQEVAHVTFDPN